ncbi:hypothetical protein AAVH_06783 [Aphelenchoides avenae]|nr:hypothetical protein AAVH_06783 [Aphelenchus avenae]
MNDDQLGKILALLEKRDRSRSPIRRRSPPRRDYADTYRQRSQPRFPVEPSGAQGREQRVEMAIAKQTATATVAAEKFYKLVEEKLDEKFKNNDENMKEFNDNLLTLAERLDAIDKQLQTLKKEAKDNAKDKRHSS